MLFRSERRLDDLDTTIEDPNARGEVDKLRQELSDIRGNQAATGTSSERLDPDDARRIVDKVKNIRGRTGRIERQAADNHAPVASSQFAELVTVVEQVASQFGSQLEKQQFNMLRHEIERLASRGDARAVDRACSELNALRWRILFKHDWFWREVFESLSAPGETYVNPAASANQIEKGRAAIAAGNGEALRDAVRQLWALQPKGSAEALQERAMRSGLRKF